MSTPEPATPSLPPTRTEPAVPGAALPASSAGPDGAPLSALDRDTYHRVLEPRSASRLPLGDGTWHQLARSYLWVRLITLGGLFAVIAVAATLLGALVGWVWVWIPAGVALLIVATMIAIAPRQVRAFGYQLRQDDLVFRRGILWQRSVAVPYGRMQLVDIEHGPLDRGFGIARLKLVTAAASTGVELPGLTQEAAEELRDTLIRVAESRRTGL
jgi:membrane protein YdbS with pleckstrin-like domain